MTDTFRAPCGFTCQGSDDAQHPAVEQSLEILKTAGLTAVIVCHDPAANEWSAGSTEDSRDALQSLCGEAAGYLCHLSRVQPGEANQ